MWNILIVLIVAVVVLMFNPFSSLSRKNPVSSLPQKTGDEINQVVNHTQEQVDYSKQLQQDEMKNVNNN